jgi:hypothetical protein
MKFRSLAIAAAVVAAVGSTGCASGAGGMFLDDEPATREHTTLTVDNNNWAQVTIYVVRSGMRTRLGQVGAMKSETFRLHPTLVSGTGEMHIVARPLASRHAFTSQRVIVSPGQRIELRLENNLNLSSFSVW